MILSIITGTLSAAFITTLNGSRPAPQRARESNDAQALAAYYVRDAQSAGGTTRASAWSTRRSASPRQQPRPIAPIRPARSSRFKSHDWASLTLSYHHVVNYFFDSSTHQIVRKTCVDGAQESILTLASFVGSVGHLRCVTNGTESDCPATPTLPDVVKVTITATNDPVNAPTPYTYTLTAKTRPEGQDVPNSFNSTPVTLLALGGACGDGVTGVDAQGGGRSTVIVYGAADVNGGCPAVNFQGSIDFSATDGVSVLSPGTCSGVDAGCGSYSTPIGDPYAALAPPAADCVNGTHPAVVGTTYSPGVYKPPSASATPRSSPVPTSSATASRRAEPSSPTECSSTSRAAP